MASLAVPAATSATEAAAATTPTQGIDVSSLQHPTTTSTINWSSVASAGKAFTGVKASEGNYYTNPFYAQDVQQATAAGLYVSPYVFANPFGADTTGGGNGSGTVQADYAWNTVISKVTSPAYASSPLMLPITVDLEPDPYVASEGSTSNACYGLTTSQMVTWIGQFLTEAKRLSGKTPIIYTTANWWNACTGNYTGFNTSPLWLASYGVTNPALPSGWNNFTIWQYSAGGSVSGISGAVDLDELGPAVQSSLLNKAIGPVQLRTLGSLATPGTSVTYSVTSGALPTGLTMSSSGLISGTPTVNGQYSVTITPSSGPAMPITWDVHGIITFTPPGNHTTTAGTPVWMRVKATDTNPGVSPSFAAAGLPPGLSITPGGVISGWPYKPGTYTVTVSASDSLAASATTTFTWTVSAASGAGAAGTLRQWGGSNKCLDDSGYGKSSGAAVDLWSCTGNWNQNWTFAQDGTVRVNGNLCLDVVGESTQNYAQMQLWACNSGDNAQQWRVGSNSQLINPRSGKCLTVAVASAANGYRPVLGTCATGNVANQHWLRPAANVYSGNAGKCLAVSGSTVVSATCANTSAQHWTESWNGTLQNGSNCLTEAGTTAGSGLSVGSCSGAAATHWQLLGVGSLPLATEIKSAASGDCVSAPSATNGVALNIQACVDTDGTTWHAE